MNRTATRLLQCSKRNKCGKVRTVRRLQFLWNSRRKTLTIRVWGFWRNQYGRDLNLFAVGRKPCANRRPSSCTSHPRMVKRESGDCCFCGRGPLQLARHADAHHKLQDAMKFFKMALPPPYLLCRACGENLEMFRTSFQHVLRARGWTAPDPGNVQLNSLSLHFKGLDTEQPVITCTGHAKSHVPSMSRYESQPPCSQTEGGSQSQGSQSQGAQRQQLQPLQDITNTIRYTNPSTRILLAIFSNSLMGPDFHR